MMRGPLENRERGFLEMICARMKEDDFIRISRHVFDDAYPCGWPSIYNNHMEAFLSSKVGSAWGAWTVRQDPETGDYIVGKHRPGEKRVYVDPDRAHLFRRNTDGSLTHIEASLMALVSGE